MIPTLRAFCASILHALSVGVEAIRTHTVLQEQSQVVLRFAVKVPELQPLAVAIERLWATTGLEQAQALLVVAGHARILQASLTQTTSPLGEFNEYPNGPEWHFSNGPVHLIAEAIREPSNCRVWVLMGGIHRGEALDCRLLPIVFEGLKTLQGKLGELLCRRVLPSHGPKLLPEIRARLNEADEQEQAYLLEAACKIDAHAMRDECRAIAFQPGWVGREAVRHLVTVDPESAAAAIIAQQNNRYFTTGTPAMVRALEYSADPVATSLLLQYLSKPRLGPIAARILRRRSDGDVAKYAQAKLADPNFTNTTELLNALTELRDPALLPIFRRYCGKINAPETKASIRGLMLIGSVESLHVLADKLDQPEFRHHALRAMWALPPRERYDALAPLLAPSLNAWLGTHALGDTVFGFFVCSDPQLPKNRGWDERWATLLIPHLDGPRRYDILHLLRVACKGNVEVCDALLGRLKDIPPLLAAATIRTLGHLGVRTAVPTLAKFVRRGSVNVRQACVWALARLGAMNEVRESLDDRDAWVRQTALKTLVLLQPPRAKSSVRKARR